MSSSSLTTLGGGNGGGGIQLGQFPNRPAKGTLGKAIRLRANFFAVTSLPQGSLFHYHVTITPELTSRVKFNQELFGLWEKANAKGAAASCPVYDGRANLYAVKKLPLPNDEGKFEIEIPNEKNPEKPQRFSFNLKLVAQVNMAALHAFLAGKGSIPQEVFQALEIVVRQFATTQFLSYGQNFYMAKNIVKISNGAEIWPGIYASLRPASNRLLVNVDIATSAFHQSGPLLEAVARALGKRNADAINQKLSHREFTTALDKIKGILVQVNYRGAARRKYRITGITPNSANDTMFDLDEGSRSVSWYFMSKYGITLRKGFLNCLIVGDPSKKIYLPMEVCDISPGQRIVGFLDEKQTADMIKVACIPPHIRKDRIQENLNALQLDDKNPYFKSFKLAVNKEMVTVAARVLPPPTVMYSGSSLRPAFGSWNLKGVRMSSGAPLDNWAVVDFANMESSTVGRFLRELVDTCNECGMRISMKNPPLRRGNRDNVAASLNAVMSRDVRLILVILPSTDSVLYGEIKRVSDTHLGIVTQCLQSKHFGNPKKQVCANICLKMNIKLGGMNGLLSPEAMPFIKQAPTIVMGADVTHPAPGDESPSICAVVGSVDERCAKFASVLSVQSSRVEIIAKLESMVTSLLKAFYLTCRMKPARLLFYRDGVSEGQFEEVRLKEITAIQRACSKLEQGYCPKITFVVVQKRHHARLFPMSREEADRSGNCLPGTVVESDITHPREFDFYLMSHGGLQGTSRPTHYHVLHDDNRFTSDSLQQLTYNMCYLYGRATRSVSICPPAYYAHLLAYRARCHPVGPSGDKEMDFIDPVPKELEKFMYYM